MPDGRVEFEITADGRKAFASIDQVTDALNKAGHKWEKDASTSTDSISGSFEGMVKKIVGAISAAKIGQMLLNIGKDAIQAASDLQEVQNVVDVTFGEAGAAKIEAWAKKAGEQFGLTETQAKRFTSTLGAMMKSAGMSGDEITSMSTDLAGLAADMASFYNLDFDTAFQKIRSGISGETEPLKQLGINMSEANLNAFALQKGLEKTFSQMTQGEKTILRYQYLMQATSDAQGDFSRTMDGFANSKRLFETNLETLKTNLGSFLMDFVNPVISGINELFSTLTQGKKRTILDDIADIDVRSVEKIAQIEETAEHARILTGVLDTIPKKITNARTESSHLLDDVPDGKSGNLKSLTDVLDGLETQAGTDKTAIGAITDTPPDEKKLDPLDSAIKGITEGAGLAADAVSGMVTPTEQAAEENALWIETCEELVKTIPGLSEIINTQTGEIKGGTQAVREYINAWEQGQKGLVLRSAHEQKRGIIDNAAAELPSLQLAKTVAMYKLRNIEGFEQAQELIKKYGINFGWNAKGEMDKSQWNGITGEDRKFLDEYAESIKDVAAEYHAASTALDEHQQAYDTAVKAWEEEGRIIEETYGKAIENLGEWSDAEKEAATERINNLNEAIKAVEEYRDQVRQATLEQVNSTLSGFGEVQTAAEMYEDAANAAEEFRKELEETHKYSQKEIEIKVNDKNAQVTLTKMNQALQSQLDYIKEYQANLEAARAAGISEDILAQLSDGSQESAQYLYAIAQAAKSGDTQAIEDLNNLWKEVNEGKETFADTLTQQKLAVDENYDAMVEKAKEAAKALDVSGDISKSTGNNIQAIAEAIKSHVPDIAEQVDAVLAQLNRLSSWGVNLNFGTSGASSTAVSGASAFIRQYETGLNFVPFDGFLASLHEGEGILTAEENRIWQAFKNGQNGVDYETLGGVMRENVKPGGDVYLDGRVVGQVVSQMQGNQYRNLQRSGWQQ